MMAWSIGGFILLRNSRGSHSSSCSLPGSSAGARRRHHGALWILGRRFAEGQITEEQFRTMRDVLESD